MPQNACTRQFQWSYFLVNHPEPKLFYTSQWGWPRIVYVIYRVAMALYFTTWLILSGVLQTILVSQRVKWFIYLTNWTFLILTLNVIILAVTAIVGYVKYKRQIDPSGGSTEPTTPLPWYLKIQWMIYNIATVGSITVTVGYWGMLWQPSMGLDPVGLNTHAINTVYVFVDLFITAMPLRILHVWYPMLYGLSYIIFTVIYQAAGGTDPAGRNYIYFVLDFWGEPALAAITSCVTVFAAIPALWIFLFGLYSLRVFTNELLCCKCSSFKADEYEVSPVTGNANRENGVVSSAPVENGTTNGTTNSGEIPRVKVISGAGSVNAGFEE